MLQYSFLKFPISWHLTLHFQAFKQAGTLASERTGSWPQLLIVVLPNGPDVRAQVRYIADIQLGVRVQCVVSNLILVP